jgi:hypothetical protein
VRSGSERRADKVGSRSLRHRAVAAKDPQRSPAQAGQPAPAHDDDPGDQPPPSAKPDQGGDAFERQVWRVNVQIVEYKAEADSDIHLILFGQGSYLIAEMPAATCLPLRTRDRRAIINARRVFLQRCGAATDTWRQLGAVAWISGVGFWDFPHGQSGHARNYAELHPVTAIRLISGCGA